MNRQEKVKLCQHKPLSKSHLTNLEKVMDDAVTRLLLVSEIAKHVGVSTSEFTRKFTATFGVAPSKYFRQMRIERARKLLKETEMPAVEIALDCGFSSQAHMISVFSEEFGISPGRYRYKVRMIEAMNMVDAMKQTGNPSHRV